MKLIIEYVITAYTKVCAKQYGNSINTCKTHQTFLPNKHYNITPPSPWHLLCRVLFSNFVRWVVECNHPQEDLTKFGYRSKRKVEKCRNLTIFWQHPRTYCLNGVISDFDIRDISKVLKRQHRYPKFCHAQGEIFFEKTLQKSTLAFKGGGGWRWNSENHQFWWF